MKYLKDDGEGFTGTQLVKGYTEENIFFTIPKLLTAYKPAIVPPFPPHNGALMGSVLLSSWAVSHSVEFRRATAMSCPEDSAPPYRANAAFLGFDCC